MSSERPEESPNHPVTSNTTGSNTAGAEPNADRMQQSAVRGDGSSPEDGSSPVAATVVVHGELVRKPQDQPQEQKASQEQPAAKASKEKNGEKDKAPRKAVSEAKVALQRRLPALDDDADVGIQKQQLVIRDGKPDLTFTGTLLASAAPPSAPQGQWKEYRIYETNGGKYVFSKLGRNVEAGKQDTHEADVFDPSPQSMPSKLLKSARELTHAGPMTWTDAAVGFFGYDPLAKALYRKLSGQFEEHIS